MLCKLFLLCFAFVFAVGLETSSIRRERSPEPSGWQGSNGYGDSAIASARSGGSWGNSALGRSTGWTSGGNSVLGRSAGWGSGGNGGYGSGRGYSANGNGKSGCVSTNGWTDSSDNFRTNGGSHVY